MGRRKPAFTLPPGDLSSRNRAFVHLLNWYIIPLKDASKSELRAIAHHQLGDPLDDTALLKRLGRNKKIGFAKCRTDQLVQQVMNDPGRRMDFACFDEYHEFYCDIEEVPEHRSVWPIFLSGRKRDRETIVDGWHRFHSYFRSGKKALKLCWYADE